MGVLVQMGARSSTSITLIVVLLVLDSLTFGTAETTDREPVSLDSTLASELMRPGLSHRSSASVVTQPQYNEVNVSGVRIYNYYPLSWESMLFEKKRPYSDARVGGGFATVLGFNETEATTRMRFLNESSMVLPGSVYLDTHNNLIHFQFVEKPSLDIYVYPGLLVSSEEICNSTEWIDALELYERRWEAVLWCDQHLFDLLTTSFFDIYWWGRPCTGMSTVVTSIRETEPSVTQHFLSEGRIADRIYSDLHFCTGSSPEARITEGSLLTFELGFLELPHLVMWAPHLSYHDIVLVSFEDNPQASSSFPFENPSLPIGHALMFSGFI